MDYEQLLKNGLNYARRAKLSDIECEDFAQEYVIKCFESNIYKKLDYFYLNYKGKLTANKRKLSNSEFGNSFEKVYLDSEINESDKGSSNFHDLIGRNDFAFEQNELIEEIDFILDILLKSLGAETKQWAKNNYYAFIYSSI